MASRLRYGVAGAPHRALSSHVKLDFDPLELHPVIRKGASVIPTQQKQKDRVSWKRMVQQHGSEHYNNFDNNRPQLSARAAHAEALRCLKCADAPCTKACPTNIDVKSFIQCISTKNYYGAAKVIFSENPLGLSTGAVCPTTDLCAGSCNLHASEEGAIKIGQLQEFATRTFTQMRIPLKPHPDAPAHKWRVALVGSGPASLSCATFLLRSGVSDVHIFEKEPVAGGINAYDLPQYRLAQADVLAEVEQVKSMGGTFHLNTSLGEDFTLDSLKQEQGFDAVFLGVGLPKPKVSPVFEGLGTDVGVHNSKDYLIQVARGSKNVGGDAQLPQLHGHVVVLGVGDVAIDCATSAFRCGAKRVTVCFRKGFNDARAVEEVFQWARDDKCDFVPFAEPSEVLLNDDGKVDALQVRRYEIQADGSYAVVDDYPLSCDHIITAFGCETGAAVDSALAPLDVSSGHVTTNPETAQTELPWCFSGGDLNGTTGMTVEASNDGKSAAWHMLQWLHANEPEGRGSDAPALEVLPGLHTVVDDVDISIDVCGVKFPNPFGLASAPPTTSIDMMARGFEYGWGFGVTKTYGLDRDMITNVSPRIVPTGHRNGVQNTGFMNIELISEKTADYWCAGVKDLKERFPEHVVISSIMCGYNKADWVELAQQTADSGCDMMEINLSCPHGMGERGMGLACGEVPEIVEEITRWVVEACPGMPVFPKMTPNITNITAIAKGAMDGGAAGVTAINTVSTLQDLRSDGRPWPVVGGTESTCPGGASGQLVRPIALKAVSEIARNLPGTPILATGGIDSGEVALNFIRMGASVCQVSSAIQQADFSIIEDYISSLKCNMYMTQRDDLKQQGWVGQQPPIHKVDHPQADLPHFGDFQQQRWAGMSEFKSKSDPVKPVDENIAPVHIDMGKVPTLQDELGASLKYLTDHMGMDYTQQTIAEVHDDLCINCGRCMMACNDCGYQAIRFDTETHQVEVSEACTGCGLCAGVCPVQGCIEMVPRTTPFTVYRGTTPGPDVPAEFLEEFQPSGIARDEYTHLKVVKPPSNAKVQ